MSYTAPQYVDTKEQAILALASTIKGEAVTGGDGSVNRALDILADVLAEQDVQVPQTDAGAILALAQYVSGGGGGGGDFTTAEVIFASDTTLPFDLACPNIFDGTFYSNVNSDDMDGETPIDVVLYKSAVNAYVASELAKVSSVSGSAEILDIKSVRITGDCTITFADANA